MLTVIEGRVLGCLMEKERTVPDQYPLSLNALVSACNQSSSREPIMALDEFEVEASITSMKSQGIVRMVHPSHGRSVTRYRQVADEKFELDDAAAAIVAVLLVPRSANRGRTAVADRAAALVRICSRGRRRACTLSPTVPSCDCWIARSVRRSSDGSNCWPTRSNRLPHRLRWFLLGSPEAWPTESPNSKSASPSSKPPSPTCCRRPTCTSPLHSSRPDQSSCRSSSPRIRWPSWSR